MKKYFLTSLLSLFLIAGTGLVLTATEKTEKEGCCSSKTTEAVQTSADESGTAAVQTGSDCGEKASEAKTDCSDVQTIQTTNVEKTDCSGSAAATTTATQTQAGECTKVPAGVGNQRASRER